MRSVLALLVLLGLVLLPGAARAATEERSPEESAEEWFENEATETLRSYAGTVFPDLTQEELEELVIEEPVPAVEISEDSSDPRGSQAEPTHFAAPVTSEALPVGVVLYDITEDGGEGAVHADAYFATRLLTRERADLLIFEPQFSTYFMIRGDTIIPVSAEALDHLAGSTSVESFLELRKSLMTDDANGRDEAVSTNNRPAIIAGIILAVFLASTLTITWLRRSPNAPEPLEKLASHKRPIRIYRPGGNRVNADD